MFSVLAMVFIAEMGDKSQFLLVALSSKYKVKDIMIGTALAISILNLMAIVLGAAIGKVTPAEYVSIAAGIAFFFFAFLSLSDEEETEKTSNGKDKAAIFVIFGTFFIAELGDKTQLATMTIAAENPANDAVWVWLGACLGLYLADMLGLIAGHFLGKKLPERVFAWISFLLFSIFGAVKLLSGIERICNEQNKALAIIITSVLTAIFALICILKIRKNKTTKST